LLWPQKLFLEPLFGALPLAFRVDTQATSLVAAAMSFVDYSVLYFS